MDPFARFEQEQQQGTKQQQQEAIFAPQQQKQQTNQFQQQDFTVFQQYDKNINSQSVEENEKDMLNGNILQELSIQPKMIAKKLYYSLPFTKIPDEVAQFPEMSYCLILLFVVLLITTIKNQTKKVPIFFGLTLYGTYVFKILISLLNQGQQSVDAFYAASAISYGLTPIIISQMLSLFIQTNKNIQFIITIIVGILSSLIMSKHLLAIILAKQQKLIICLACSVYCMFWMLILM